MDMNAPSSDYGRIIELSPGLRHILAPNPSPMTYYGTNTYLIGEREIAVVDPGPAAPEHLEAILAAVPEGGHVSTILLTHTHIDHTALVPELKRRTGAEVLAFGGAEAGRSPVMARLAAEGALGGGEGQDAGFEPDGVLTEGACLRIDGQEITSLHTPGHTANHLAFAVGDELIVGDLVMGWASSLVSPPDGELSAFLASLERLSRTDWTRLHPGHGAAIEEPRARMAELIAHRRMRHDQIRTALADAPGTAEDLARLLYTDIPPALLPAAARNVLAHLIELHETFEAQSRGPLTAGAVFELS